MRYKKQLILGTVLIFIIMNIFLVVNDKTGKVKRTTYINEWEVAKQKDMSETLSTDGVLDYMSEELVYLDDESGMFESFDVEQGETVNVGDGLYTYKVQSYYEMKAKLDSEVERLDGEIIAVDAAIAQMNATTINQINTELVFPESTETVNITQDTSEAEMIKEQYIIEKEKEKGQLEAQLSSVNSQLTDLTLGEATITVESPFAGKVTAISETLENPIITIESAELHVIGELTENERMNVEEGMVAITELTAEKREKVPGIISNVSEEPKQLKIDGESIYPFEVSFDEALDDEEAEAEGQEALDEDKKTEDKEELSEQLGLDEDIIIDKQLEIDEQAELDPELVMDIEREGNDSLYQGYHADVHITLKESLDAIVLKKDVVLESYTWHMQTNGRLVKLPIKSGIEMDGYIEIVESVAYGNWVADMPENRFRDKSVFITPLKPSKTTLKEMYKNGPRTRSLVIGLLGR